MHIWSWREAWKFLHKNLFFSRTFQELTLLAHGISWSYFFSHGKHQISLTFLFNVLWNFSLLCVYFLLPFYSYNFSNDQDKFFHQFWAFTNKACSLGELLNENCYVSNDNFRPYLNQKIQAVQLRKIIYTRTATK